MSTVDRQHPEYTFRKPEWDMMRDCALGPARIKHRSTQYLPMPSGWLVQSDKGVGMYASYIQRAQFPELLAPTLSGIVGVIHRKEVEIEGLPAKLEYLWESCTQDGLTLEEFHKMVTTEILLMGSYNILVDVDESGLPRFAPYAAENRINWDPNRDFFVFDESAPSREDFEWKDVTQHRVLELVGGEYRQRLFVEKEQTEVINVLTARRQSLPFIPLVTITPINLGPHPDAPPLAGVARSSLAMYRLDADWRFQLFMSGQETLVVTGIDDSTNLPTTVGASVVTGLPAGADMKYVGPSGKGIEAHERALEREKQAAIAAGTRVWDTMKREAESGRALEIRSAAQTATFTTVSMSSGKGLERALRYAAYILGESAEVIRKIVVKPNLEFVENKMPAQDVVNMVEGWMSGAYSYDTLYRNLRRGGVANEERTAEEEQDQIKKEQAAGIKPPEKTPSVVPKIPNPTGVNNT